MLQAILNKSWKQHIVMKQHLYSHLPPISKTIWGRWTRHVRHCCRSKDDFISDILLWTTTHGCACVGQAVRTSLLQLCVVTGWICKTCQEWWMIGAVGERESRKSMLSAQLDDECVVFFSLSFFYILSHTMEKVTQWKKSHNEKSHTIKNAFLNNVSTFQNFYFSFLLRKKFESLPRRFMEQMI